MVEGSPVTDGRVMPKIEGKDRIEDPFVIEIRDAFKKLKLPFDPLRPNIGAENRIVRNAGIVVGQFRSRYFESKIDIEKRKLKKEWLEGKASSGTLTEKDIDQFLGLKTKENRYARLLDGKLSREETTAFLEEMQEQIPRTLRIVPGLHEVLGDSPKLSIGELIALSSIHKDQKEKVLENALSYLMHSEGVGSLVLEELSDYLLKLESGIYEAVFNDKHVTPLSNGFV
ncbi:MAG: hypothetical protein WEC80_00995 [Patescibacteria group bacterium]